ncbi:transposase [Paenibacillus polymyxa]|uniref:transposase n=1 Tax=Paenibacillus polymyxa TaxID=1406 RepID=UPI00307E34B9
MSTRYEIQDQQWRQIQDLFPPERKPQGGRPAVDNRIMLNAMLWVARSGAPWRDMPEIFPNWKICLYPLSTLAESRDLG